MKLTQLNLQPAGIEPRTICAVFSFPPTTYPTVLSQLKYTKKHVYFTFLTIFFTVNACKLYQGTASGPHGHCTRVYAEFLWYIFGSNIRGTMVKFVPKRPL